MSRLKNSRLPPASADAEPLPVDHMLRRQRGMLRLSGMKHIIDTPPGHDVMGHMSDHATSANSQWRRDSRAETFTIVAALGGAA